MPNVTEIKQTFCGQTYTNVRIDGRTYICTHGRMDQHLRPTLLGWLSRVDPESTQSPHSVLIH